MKYLTFFLTLFLFGMTWSNDVAAQMNNAKLLKIIEREAEDIGGETGAWHLYLKDRVLLILTDEENNRMRIFTPIVEERVIGADDMHKMLEANFESALDAKYCIYEGFVISSFTHPFKELSEAQLIDAMHQVIRLAETYGSTYSSTELHFGGQAEEDNDADEGVKPATRKKS
jgi:hypothetical protein